MTTALSAEKVKTKLDENLASSVIQSFDNVLLVDTPSLPAILTFLKNTPGLDFDYLNDITAIDYWDYFELVYQLTSLTHNHKILVKIRIKGRENPEAPSIVSLYKGATYQEREIHDLMGINFIGHPSLKPLVLWEGFQGYPLRKDFTG